MSTEFVILVNENDEQLGTCEKLLAHQTGQLHRAISVFIFNSEKKMLLQRRAASKYHSAGLWTNACCSHPRPGEQTSTAAQRRLSEEMGINHPSLHFLFSFIYKSKLDNGLTEHELDHVFVGISDTVPNPDPLEASNWEYRTLNEIAQDLEVNPSSYTYWFKLIFNRVITEVKQKGWL